MKDFRQKLALVTGGSSGMCLELEMKCHRCVENLPARLAKEIGRAEKDCQSES